MGKECAEVFRNWGSGVRGLAGSRAGVRRVHQEVEQECEVTSRKWSRIVRG